MATADAYLTVIARHRDVDANVRARDLAKAHFDYAHELLQQGAGSRLNELRAQQELSTDETLVETFGLALYRAQEALGVLIVADGPVDAVDEPVFAVPPDTPAFRLVPRRRSRLARGGTDLKLFATSSAPPSASSRTAARIGCRTSTRRFSPRRPIHRSSSFRRTAGGS